MLWSKALSVLSAEFGLRALKKNAAVSPLFCRQPKAGAGNAGRCKRNPEIPRFRK